MRQARDTRFDARSTLFSRREREPFIPKHLITSPQINFNRSSSLHGTGTVPQVIKVPKNKFAQHSAHKGAHKLVMSYCAVRMESMNINNQVLTLTGHGASHSQHVTPRLKNAADRGGILPFFSQRQLRIEVPWSRQEQSIRS